MILQKFTFKIVRQLLIIALIIINTIAIAEELDSTSLCNAAFTFELDTTGALPVYTLIATAEGDSSKSFLWNIGGELERTGSRIEHIFFDAGLWHTTLTVSDSSDICSTVQNIAAIPPSSDACFFNVWSLDSGTFQYAFETWLPFYADMSFSLNYGDGSSLEHIPEFGVPITHTYDSPGVYEVCQTMNEDGCSYCKEIVVGSFNVPNCDTGFTYLADSSNQYRYSFISEETSDLYEYLWEINEEIVSNDPSFEYIFSDSGTYQIALFLINAGSGDTCSITEVIAVPYNLESCDASFTYNIDSISTNNWIFNLTANSTDTTNTFVWGLPQGIAFGRELSYVHTEAGNFDVNLVIFNEEDTCSSSQNILAPEPNGCILNISEFDENTIDIISGTQSIIGQLYYTMDFGDGMVVSGEQAGGGTIGPFSYNYREDGVFNVCLSATDSLSFSCEVCQEVEIILPSCSASFNYQEIDSANNNYLFTPLEISELYSYRWNVNGEFLTDQLPSSDPSFNYTFPSSGIWNVSLYRMNISSGDVCFTSEIINIPGDTIECPTSFVYQPIDSTNTFRYLFTPLIIDSQRTFLWEIEGGFQSTNTLLEYTFPDAGLWNVTLNQISNNGDTCSATRTIEVPPGNLHIYGSVFADLIPADGGVVSLYQKQTSDWIHINDVSTDNGAFNFSNLAPGRYLLHARGDAFVHQAFIPTYFVNGVGWQDAYTLDLFGSAEEVKITLIRSQSLSSGQGRIQGRVITNEPAEPFVILLKDRASRNTVKWTISGTSHSFDFNQLPFGEYLLTVEKPSQSFSRSIDLTENQANISGIELNPNVILSSEEEFSEKLAVYPTFIEDHVFLNNQTFTRLDLTLELRSMTGDLVMSEVLELNAGETTELALPNIDDGIYFMRTTNKEGHSTVTKLIK
ncbi:MAG: hypothetical protein AAF363_08910 [Bacteroidota bacterium]